MSEAVVKRAAVVTGGSRGIGRAICVALAKQGCNVVVNYCHGVDAAAETVAQCTTLGVQAVAVQADVSTAEGCKKLFEEAVNAFGRVDILVNNAGVTRDNLILRLSEEDFDKVLNANLKGAFLCCKEAARRMVRQRSGRIINLSSVVALRDQFAPPTIHYEQPDPECDLDYVPNVGREMSMTYALSNSLGFGGHNACLLLRKWEG